MVPTVLSVCPPLPGPVLARFLKKECTIAFFALFSTQFLTHCNLASAFTNPPGRKGGTSQNHGKMETAWWTHQVQSQCLVAGDSGEACEGSIVEVFCSEELRFSPVRAEEAIKGLSKGAQCHPLQLLILDFLWMVLSAVIKLGIG